MHRKSFGNMKCPIGRALERVGEWWSILIIRDAFYGMTKFDEFEKSLDIAPTTLTKRLNSLVEAGVFERRQYQDRPPRFEYLLTPLGREFRPVLWSLLEWGSRHLSPEGPAVQLVDVRNGQVAKPVMVDARSGTRLSARNFVPVAGPAANAAIRGRLEFAHNKRRDPSLKPPHFAPDGETTS